MQGGDYAGEKLKGDNKVKESRREKRDNRGVTGGNEEGSPCKQIMKGRKPLKTEEEGRITDK